LCPYCTSILKINQRLIFGDKIMYDTCNSLPHFNDKCNVKGEYSQIFEVGITSCHSYTFSVSYYLSFFFQYLHVLYYFSNKIIIFPIHTYIYIYIYIYFGSVTYIFIYYNLTCLSTINKNILINKFKNIFSWN